RASPAVATLSLHDARPILVYDNPSSLEPAAQALGLEPRLVEGVTRDGLLGVEDVGERAAAASADAAIFEDPRVRSTLFSTALLRSEEHTSELQSRENLVCR